MEEVDKKISEFQDIEIGKGGIILSIKEITLKKLVIFIIAVFLATNVFSGTQTHTHDKSTKHLEEYKYIKAETPAGFNAVIGMKNPLEELKPDIITENGQTIKVFTLTVKDVGFEIFPNKPMMG